MGHLITAIALLAWLIPAPVRAGSADNFSGDILSLNYYPHAGIFLLSPSLSASLRSESLNTNGIDNYLQYNAFALALSYGIAAGIRLKLSDTVLWDESSEQSSATSAGFSNPALNLTWRAIEASELGISFDLGLTYAPLLGHRIAANANLGVVGNNLSAPELVGIAEAFWTSGFNQVSATYSSTEQFEARTEAATVATSYRSSKSQSRSWSVADRVHFGARYFAEGTLTWTRFRSVLLNYGSGDISSKYTDPVFNQAVGFGFRPEPYYLLEFTLAFEGSAGHTVSADTKSVSAEAHRLVAGIEFRHQLW